jgi:nicotinate-nucleotide pyrophosphorylase (carboxylating)
MTAQQRIIGKSPMEPDIKQIDRILSFALAEDIGEGDITTQSTVSPDAHYTGYCMAKEHGVIAGLQAAERVFHLLDPSVQMRKRVLDGDEVEEDTVLANLEGPGRALLSGERVALNVLQRMSGIATLTRRYVEAVHGTKAIILDTRKTAPGLRVLDKWAVRLGGAQNHRLGLYDMVLIKDNHIAAAGGISEAVRRVREMDRQKRPIEVEVTDLQQLQEALQLKVDRIMLDNMDLEQLRQAVGIVAGRIPLEASGNVTLDSVAAIAATGVDFISVGSLTHSAKALDINLTLSGEK